MPQWFFRLPVIAVVLSSVSILQANEVVWVVNGPPQAEIRVRRAGPGRADAWNAPYRSRVGNGRVEVHIDLPAFRHGYDVIIQPLDQNGRPNQTPLNSKEPLHWEELPATIVVKFADNKELDQQGRRFWPSAEFVINGRNYGFEDYDGEIRAIVESSWNSDYVDASGRSQKAQVKFAGASGSYMGPVTGQLANITYFRQEDNIVIDGNWSVNRQSGGRFVFIIDGDGKKFSGQYWFGNKTQPYVWIGTRANTPK